MKKHYTNEHSSAEVVVNTSLPDELNGVLELTRVWTDPDARKQGYATELLKSIMNEADIEGVVLILNPRTFGKAPGLENLAKWYERFGFSMIQTQPIKLMARMPQVYKTKLSPVAGACSEVVRG